MLNHHSCSDPGRAANHGQQRAQLQRISKSAHRPRYPFDSVFLLKAFGIVACVVVVESVIEAGVITATANISPPPLFSALRACLAAGLLGGARYAASIQNWPLTWLERVSRQIKAYTPIDPIAYDQLQQLVLVDRWDHDTANRWAVEAWIASEDLAIRAYGAERAPQPLTEGNG